MTSGVRGCNERECSAPGDGPSSLSRPLATDGGAAGRALAAEVVRRAGLGGVRIARRLVRPLRSRKVRVALATVASAYAAKRGLELNEEVLMAILSVGVALILGIAHEDAGRAGAQRGEGDRCVGGEVSAARPCPGRAGRTTICGDAAAGSDV